MAKAISTLVDPFGTGFGELITGKNSSIVNVSDLYYKGRDQSNIKGADTSSTSNSPAAGEGVITDSEAQALAKQRLFRSGTIYTSTLGEQITSDQLSGTRLQ